MGASITSLGRKKNLSSLLHYAANPSKKEKCVAITGVNCNDDFDKALKQMNRTRTTLNKSKDITQAYHVVHSFDKILSKELTQQQMHAIAIQFAEEAFPHCQILVASHNDKEHFHSHLVINNIDTETGKRIRIDPNDLEKMRKLNDKILLENNLEPIDNEYYENLERRQNIYSNDSTKLKNGQLNHQEVVQNAIEETLENRKVNSFESFSDELAKKYNIEVYRFSKNSNKLGYVLYKKEVDFYNRREELVALGKNKDSRKAREQYVERTFSARKLGKKYSFEQVSEQLSENNYLTHIDNYFNGQLDSEQEMSLNSQYNKQTGELEIPFVELDSTADKQFKHANKRKNYLPYPSFLEAVDHHYSNTFASIDDEEYEIKLHTHVHTKTLRSTKSKKITVKKSDRKEFYLPAEGFKTCPHTPSAKQLHYQISRVINDDVKMYRAKNDYEFMERMVQNQQQQQQDFDMGY